MRRLFLSSAIVGLLSLGLGCHHMHGVCDCDQGDNPCCYYNTPTPVAAPSAPPPVAASAMPAGPVDQSREKLPPPADKAK